jgi:hypothetical protein
MGLLFVMAICTACTTVKQTSITQLDDSFEIVVIAEEQSLIPLHPDKGVFPKLHREVRFITVGKGSDVKIDGHEYKKFVIGKDIVPTLEHCVYSKGEVLFSWQLRKLIIKTTLAKEYSHYSNLSGTYENVDLFFSPVIELTNASNLYSLSGKHIRLRGYFLHEHAFVSESGIEFEAAALCIPKSKKTIQILARVIQPNFGPTYLYVLRIEGDTHNCCTSQ